jgi:D-alanine--D-alanine ligase
LIRRVVILHNPVEEGADPSTSDVLEQVGMVESGLAALGIPSTRLAVAGGRVWEGLSPSPESPDTVGFNLVEAPPGASHLHSDNAAVLDLLGIPFTGSSAAALRITTDKIAARALLADAGLPVPPGGRLDFDDPAVLDRVPPPWILKPAWEDASVGLEGDPVCASREAALERAAHLAARFPGQPVLAERFLPGREFNVSLLEDVGGVQALPVGEIVFEGFPEGMSRVVGYEAKWKEGSFECEHTVPRFPSDPADAGLLDRVRRLALAAWRVCGLSGYARVDLRLDETGEPYILEVNGNPCISSDSGFLRAARQAGLQEEDVVRRILEAALRRRGAPEAPPPRPSHRTGVAVRRGLDPADRAPLEELLWATGFFNAEEVGIALELVDDRLSEGEASHYRFLVGEIEGQVAGYACWGPIPGTAASADLYWIVVHPGHQGQGAGAALLAAAEAWMAEAGRTRVYVETSTRAQYAPTRAFYLACGYGVAAELPDFYAPGDGKALFLKVL